MQDYEYIIVGGGAMGVSTAFYLSKQSESILVLDHHHEGAASRDVNKIVRFDYTDPFYMRLAREARSDWMTNPLFKDYFHPSGRVVIYEDETQLSSISANHQQIGLAVLEELTTTDADGKLKGLVKCPTGLNAAFNPLDAWVNFPQCIDVMRSEAQLRGSKFEKESVEELCYGPSGQCIGVKIKGKSIYCSAKVIITTGAWTEKLLKSGKASCNHLDGARNLPVATGVCVAHFILSDHEFSRFGQNPIFSFPGHGEILPPTDDKILKMTVVKSFTNTDPDLQISVPPDADDIPKVLYDDVRAFVDSVCPILSSRDRIVKIYWDGVTTLQDPVIDTLLSNVVVATGGSYHFAKFLPIIGKSVVDEINGILDEPRKSRWSLSTDRSSGSENQPYLVARRDLQNL